MAAKTLELPGNVNINPRDVISRLQDGEDLGDIADDYEMSDSALLNDLEKARQYFAPFADFWNQHRDEITFAANGQETDETPDEAEEISADADENEPDDSENDEAETEEEPEDEDPY